jgi:hypothetical protein
MPRFYFRTLQGDQSSVSDTCEFVGHSEAWAELTKVCGDLVRGVGRNLAENSEWSMELLDVSGKPVSRIRLVAETVTGQ